MSLSNSMNVYSGPNAVKNYFDPDIHPPLPLVEIPESLNPYYGDGVRIYAKMVSMHPANNIKIFPAMAMLNANVDAEKTKTVIEYSSGSTVISMALTSRIYHGIQDVRAFLSNKTSASKLKLMQFFGLNLTLFGGPSQPEPQDERGGIQRARRLAELDERFVNANQYENDANWRSHVRWTGPQIHKQLPQINLICAGLGTSGTMTGIGSYFKLAKPSVARVGVCTAPGDRVPGPRSLALLGPVEFPWQDAVDAIEEVGSHDSFSLSLEMCRQGLICGPSSGFNLKGLLQYIERRKSDGTLSQLPGADGLVNCVFICCDLPYQYIDEYFSKLGDEAFHPINNINLAGVDLYRYDEAWELSPQEALSKFFVNTKPSPDTIHIDLRKACDFAHNHIPQAFNLPLQSLSAETPSPFSDPSTLESQWKELEDVFSIGRLKAHDLFDKSVCITCYDGDTARVATSILRSKKISASSVRGGFAALMAEMALLQTGERDELGRNDSPVENAE